MVFPPSIALAMGLFEKTITNEYPLWKALTLEIKNHRKAETSPQEASFKGRASVQTL
ncbi:hypothetical protein [Entomobacter blattae]|uniref:hypothetical protein n=1 Tax=Entomobacter blattae TaxID=2762277 RepID=UPI00193BC82E|nr:hypothetical protein [Entomobacter blattae]